MKPFNKFHFENTQCIDLLITELQDNPSACFNCTHTLTKAKPKAKSKYSICPGGRVRGRSPRQQPPDVTKFPRHCAALLLNSCCERWRLPPSASMLKRWKHNWCDLWIDGSLVFYKSDSRRDYETRVGLKNSCINVRSGLECAGEWPLVSRPPVGLRQIWP